MCFFTLEGRSLQDFQVLNVDQAAGCRCTCGASALWAPSRIWASVSVSLGGRWDDMLADGRRKSRNNIRRRSTRVVRVLPWPNWRRERDGNGMS